MSVYETEDMWLSSQRHRLLELMVIHCYKKGTFTLSSGRTSDFYINCKKVLSAHGLELIAQQFYHAIKVHCPHARAIGGLTMGADPLAFSTAMWSTLVGGVRGLVLDPFSIRKEPKKHGTQDFYEGPQIDTGTATVIVEDVITTGASAIKAIQRATEQGMAPKLVLALVDREEDNGRETIVTQQKIPVVSIFTKTDFMTFQGVR